MAHKHSVYDTDPHFKIDPATRSITNLSTTKIFVVQHDHNSERFTFEIPRYIDGHDMSLSDKIEVHFDNIAADKTGESKSKYKVDDMQISPDSDDVVIFSWLLSNLATMYAGALNFWVRFSCMTGGVVDYVWGTDKHKGITVLESGDYEDFAPTLSQEQIGELVNVALDEALVVEY